MTDRHNLTDAEVVAAIIELVAPTRRDVQKVETIIKTVVEAVLYALAHPDLGPSEIALRIKRRKSPVVVALRTLRALKATGYPPDAPDTSEKRFPSRGNPTPASVEEAA